MGNTWRRWKIGKMKSNQDQLSAQSARNKMGSREAGGCLEGANPETDGINDRGSEGRNHEKPTDDVPRLVRDDQSRQQGKDGRNQRLDQALDQDLDEGTRGSIELPASNAFDHDEGGDHDDKGGQTPRNPGRGSAGQGDRLEETPKPWSFGPGSFRLSSIENGPKTFRCPGLMLPLSSLDREETVDKVEALRSSPLLRALSDSELHSLMGIANERSLAAGQTLITAGEKGVAMYIILEGKVQVSRGGTALSVLGPGQHVGEMALLAPDDIVRSADVVAIEPTRILQIAAWDLSTFIDSNPAVAKAIIAELARRLALADERLVSILAGGS